MDDVKKGVANVARSIAKGSGTLIKTTKLTLDLSGEESKLKTLYTEIGKKVHEIYSYGGSLGEYFDQRYQDILEHQRKINELREALDIAKGVKTCPKCGKTSPRASVFCPKCGEGMTDVPEKTAEGTQVTDFAPQEMPPIPPSQVPPKPTTKRCNVCGSSNDPHDRFCLSCGRIL
ncbi:MAG: zinc ribbon domain-containing protein [Defluviitaleaceae bacterium]|nr:zinc ribbon domain-containing protein [Defluviitaleaceae bacterium]